MNDRVSTLHHRKLIAEFDEERLLAYEAFKQDQEAFAKVWPRSKVMSKSVPARLATLKKARIAAALRVAARLQYWLRPCGGT